MKIALALSTIAIVGGGFYFANPYSAPNVYAMTPAQAYEKLRDHDVVPSGSGPYGMAATSVSGTPGEQVTWESGVATCHAYIAPEGTAKSRIEASCENRGEGAAAGLTGAMYWKATIELIDSTLKDRAFDPDAALGKTAWNWPADRIAHGDINDAVGEAYEMQAEMQSEIASSAKDLRAADKAAEHAAEMERTRALLNQ